MPLAFDVNWFWIGPVYPFYPLIVKVVNIIDKFRAKVGKP
jgi:hypothetical protein